MQVFLLVWFGQVISLLGSKLTEFALGVWVYEKTGSITQFAIIVLLISLPNILISPFAGALIDRWDRRWAMILSDAVAGLTGLGVMLLVMANSLEIWHVYLAVAIISSFEAFQIPAYSASITVLVPKENLGRANGMVQVSKAIAKLISPLLAGFLVKSIGIEGILIIDVFTFIFSLITLLLVRFPEYRINFNKQKINFNKLWRETIFSWHYIAKRPGLQSLLMFMAITYFTLGATEVVFWPFVLNLGSSSQLGQVLSVGGLGMVFGSLLISTWGGPKTRIYGILFFVFLQGIFMILGGLQYSLFFAGLGIFGYLFCQPIIVSCDRSIWQSKIPLNLQGRVFALQQMLERSLAIVAYITTGPLVERILEPLMDKNGFLANSIGHFIGVGQGKGMGLLLALMGIINILAALISYREPRLRLVESELPDAETNDLKQTLSNSI